MRKLIYIIFIVLAITAFAFAGLITIGEQGVSGGIGSQGIYSRPDTAAAGYLFKDTGGIVFKDTGGIIFKDLSS